MFKQYDTNCIKIMNIFSAEVNGSDIGKKTNQFGETDFYQLGIKLNGRTNIYYNEKYLNYKDNTVLYLPRENQKNIKYNKEYISKGYGICIFFTSEFPLSNEAEIYDCRKTPLPQLFKEILHSYNSGNLLEIKSIFYKILYELDNIENNRFNNTFKKKVIDYVNNADININIDDIMNLFNYSNDHFRHKFHKEFNMSPKEFILCRKIETAEKNLLHTNFNIADISTISGFSDSNYFSRVFKLKTKYTPSEFRKKFKKFL